MACAAWKSVRLFDSVDSFHFSCETFTLF